MARTFSTFLPLSPLKRMSWATALFGKELLVKDGEKVVSKPTEEALKGKKFVALYFSAHVSFCLVRARALFFAPAPSVALNAPARCQRARCASDPAFGNEHFMITPAARLTCATYARVARSCARSSAWAFFLPAKTITLTAVSFSPFAVVRPVPEVHAALLRDV